jgi:hypothetical protein
LGSPRGIYWLTTTLWASAVAYFWSLETLRTPNVFDAAGYHQIAQQMLSGGILTKHDLSDIRLYGYPAFLSLILRGANYWGWNERVLGFGVQLSLYWAAAGFLAWSLARCGVRAWAWRAALAMVAAHPLALLYPGFFLTESVAFSFGIVLLSLAVLAWERRGGVAVWVAGGLVCGAMIMVRPASVFILPVWGLVVAKGLGQRQWKAGLGMLFLLVPLAPQWWINWTYHGQFTPLIASPITHAMPLFGILNAKYATAMISGVEPPVTYPNPFLVDESLARQDPMAWYLMHPAAGLATWALHLFNTLDQDLPLPFVTDLDPPYGPWVSAANWAVVGLGLMSLLATWRAGGSPGERAVIWVSTGLIAGNLGGYGFSMVESRYGVAALIPLYGWAAVGAAWLLHFGGWRERWVAVTGMAVVGALGLGVSSWVREYAPMIQDARGLAPRRPVSVKAKHPLCESAWTRWEVSRTRIGPSGELVLAAGGAAEHPVAMTPGITYWIDIETTGTAVASGPFEITLGGGAGAYQWVRFAQQGSANGRIRLAATGGATRIRNVRFGLAEARPPSGDGYREHVLQPLDGTSVFCSEQGAVALLSRPVTLEKNTEYEVTFEIRSEPPGTGEMSIDLFGPGYDAAEQNGFVREFRGEFERKQIRWNSGPLAPARAELRFATLNEFPIVVRDIRFRKVD